MSEIFWAGTRKGLFQFSRTKAKKWQITKRCFLGDPVNMFLHDSRDRLLYAALNLGHFGVKLHRSANDGVSWEEIGVPSYANLAGDPLPNLALIWSLESGADGCLWAGTIPGGLFKSIDKGSTWTINSALWNDPTRKQWISGGYDQPGIHSICINPQNPQQITLAISTAGVWISKNNGESWQLKANGMRAEYMPPEQQENPLFQDVHRMVQCSAQPNHLWIQHHNGIFRTVDGCDSWQEIKVKPSSFGFAAAVHPDNPDKAWFVPGIKDNKRYPVEAKFIVTRTEDGGKSFQILERGLPIQESYDLVYRHCLEIDESGDRLVMASTTGNCWISENGGDDWHCLSQHLPPVYCLRFS